MLGFGPKIPPQSLGCLERALGSACSYTDHRSPFTWRGKRRVEGGEEAGRGTGRQAGGGAGWGGGKSNGRGKGRGERGEGVEDKEEGRAGGRKGEGRRGGGGARPDDRCGEPAPKHPRKEYPEKHCGRGRLGAIRDANRDKLFNAPSSGDFWKEVKRLADPKPDPIAVTAESLREVFEKRLNPPAVMPTAFDEIQHKINQTLASVIQKTTQDTQPELHLSTTRDAGMKSYFIQWSNQTRILWK